MATRRARGLTERIYLLEASVDCQTSWTLRILASSMNIYTIHLSPEFVGCSCPDFQKRHSICKHLFFVVLRVLRNVPAEVRLETVEDIKLAFADVLHPILLETLHTRIGDNADSMNATNSTNNNNVYDVHETCCICFEEFGSEETIVCSTSCQNRFHSKCMRMWNLRNQTCPLCRCPWNPVREFSTHDPLAKFDRLQIEHK